MRSDGKFGGSSDGQMGFACFGGSYNLQQKNKSVNLEQNLGNTLLSWMTHDPIFPNLMLRFLIARVPNEGERPGVQKL